MSSKDISVVIGFKDWGLRRLRLAVSTIRDSFGELDGEVIVSDYGSAQSEDTKRVLESLGARYVYTETDGSWSRSRALNAGFAVSSGRVLVSTDADMVFSPRSMETIGRIVLDSPTSALLLQCRDLPKEWTDAEIDEHGADWDAFDAVGRRRPRWGMGGMMAVSREMFLRVRGFDERMKTYGGEDIDFAQRVRRAGARLIWVEHPLVRMYHMWHPSTADRHALSPEESAQVDANKAIMREDKTFVRNVRHWAHRPADARPLVSVVISTFNRAHLILDTLHSVQAQTVQDFEVVVIDDGSTDDTRAVIESLEDDRIRYVHQENAGVAAARNRGVSESRGHYVVVLDDDDIALPWRIEAHFLALTEGVHATYGAFANFDNTTGATHLFATKHFTEETTADKGGAPGHSTWMVDRDLMAAIGYDESLPSGIDNNFALRSLRSGLVWKHTGRILTLRRMHDAQITALLTESQVSNARGAYEHFTFLATTWGLAKLRKERGNADYGAIMDRPEDLTPFLPDHLVWRSLTGEVGSVGPRRGTLQATSANGVRRQFVHIEDLTWKDLAELRGEVGGAALTASLRDEDSEAVRPADVTPLQSLTANLRAECWPAGAGKRDSSVLVELVVTDQSALTSLEECARDSATIIQQDDAWMAWIGFVVPSSELDGAHLKTLARQGRLTVHGGPGPLTKVKQALFSADEEI